MPASSLLYELCILFAPGTRHAPFMLFVWKSVMQNPAEPDSLYDPSVSAYALLRRIAHATFWIAAGVPSPYHSFVQCCVMVGTENLHLPMPLVYRFPLSLNHATAMWEQLEGGGLYSENTYCGLFPENSCVLGVNCIHCSTLTYNFVVVQSKYAPHSGSTSRHLLSGSINHRCQLVGKHCLMAVFHLFHALSFRRPCCGHLMLE